MDGACEFLGPRHSQSARPVRRARSWPRHEPESTWRRATACFVCAVSSLPPAERWTSTRISLRIRWREWRLSPEAPGAEVRAVAARLVARVLDERVAADELLPAAEISDRDRPLLSALVLGCLRWHY